MKTLSILCLLLCSILAKGQQSPVLVTADWVNDNLKNPNLVVVHVSYSKYDYDREHIAGSRYLWPEWLAPNTPETNFNAPDVKVATEILQKLGINEDSHVVLYHVRNETSVTARMFLTLEHFGLKGRVSYLNGGLEAWKNEGYPLTDKLPEVKKGNFKASAGNLLVDRHYVANAIKSGNTAVVDARPTRYYDGEPVGYPRNGHIAGSKNIQWTDMFDESNFFKPNDQLDSYFNAVASKDKEVITYCFIGQTASAVYMAGRLLGYDIRLYDGSMQEWSRFDELPMEVTQK